MPLYDYLCPCCGEFAVQRGIADRDRPAPCPFCRTLGARMITAPNLSLMNPGQRQAHQRNEKSRHEPGLQNRHRCGSSCGCGSKSQSQGPRKKARTVEVPKLGKFETPRRRNRPWMLGH